MKIMEFLHPQAIRANMESSGKKKTIEELVDLLISVKAIGDKEIAMKALLEREKLGSTGIGQGLAIPHAKSEGVRKLVGAFGRSPKGIDFESIDGNPAHLVFLLVGPPNSPGAHLKALARISRLLRDEPFRQVLLEADTDEQLLRAIREEDEKRH